jgi:hypothetical protein
VASYLVGQRTSGPGLVQEERDAVAQLTDEVRKLRASVERLEREPQDEEPGDHTGGSEAA